MKNRLSVVLFGFIVIGITPWMTFGCSSTSSINSEEEISNPIHFIHRIPTVGNSWKINGDLYNQPIGKEGIENWEEKSSIIRTYFKVMRTGQINIGIYAKNESGPSTIEVSFAGESHRIDIDQNFKDIEVASFHISQPGYYYIEMKGLTKQGSNYGFIKEVLIGGEAAEEDFTYVKEDFYWGRRGPSVHLNYEFPEGKDIRYFYNEITVPKGEDVLGSYFMATGFGHGYFGIQVNSDVERRILFSVWSPFKTHDPKEIPDDQKIVLLDKGEGVYTGEFGNEGSGGQSYWRYNWKSDTTYKFLFSAQPVENDFTIYTAYFYAPELGDWKLIASFKRPKTQNYITRPHSFLENFHTETGFISRKVFFSNQWAVDTDGQWHELTKMKFTADATARKGSRLDFSGGSEGNRFYLRNCGFFSDMTEIDTYHEREFTGQKPDLDFDKLK